MKTLATTLLTLLFAHVSLSQSEPNCGVVASFSYTVVGNTVVFTNTTTSMYDDVEIVSNHWSFGDGTTSNEINPTHEYSSFCNTTVCLLVTADSSNLGTQYCGFTQYCEEMDFGSQQLQALITQDIDEVNENFNITMNATGGNPAYSYQWTLNGFELNVSSNTIEIGFANLSEVVNPLIGCVSDQNGCSSCVTTLLTDPNALCEVSINFTVTGSYVSATPELQYAGENQNYWTGYLQTIPDSLHYIYGPINVGLYVNDIGTHTYCLNLTEQTLETYPNCPAEVCETIEVTEISQDCNATFLYSNTNSYYIFENFSTGNYNNLIWNIDGIEYYSSAGFAINLSPGTHQISLTVFSDETTCTDSYSETITIPELAYICGNVYVDENNNGQYDGGEYIPDSLDVLWNDYTLTYAWGEFSGYVYPGTGCLTFGLIDEAFNITNNLGYESCGTNGLSITLTSGQVLCPITLGIDVIMNSICGTFYNDINDNQIQEENEPGIPYALIEVHTEVGGLNSIYTDDAGNYCYDIPINTNFWLIPHYLANENLLISPDYYWNSFQTETILDDINFGVHFTTDELDMGVILSSYSNPVPGFPITYRLLVQNYSNVSGSANITLTYDELQSFLLAESNGLVDEINQTVTWSIDLAPFQIIELHSFFQNSVEMELGEQVATYAQLIPTGTEPDILNDNNNTSLSQTIVGSYDPNNKLVQPQGVGISGNILPSTEKLTYTVNFQNTGTAPAVTVIVTDTIDNHLEVSSFQMLGATHNVQTLIQGNQIIWTFNNIMLPDSFSNEPESHGQIVYSISPKNNLANGTEITNTAYIYFDFNEPIITNTALNTIDITLDTEEILPNEKTLVYPNPINNFFNIILEEDCELRITDINGRLMLIKQLKAQSHRIDTSQWSQGVYTLSILNEDTRKTMLIVKQ